MRRAIACMFLVTGCSLIAPIRDHVFDLDDGGAGVDAGRTDAGRTDAGRTDAGRDDAGSDGGFDAGPQCSPPCMADAPICNVGDNACVECLEDVDCDDGDFCTVDHCNLDFTCTSTEDTLCVSEVSVGSGHSCALRASGGVRCWGDNSHGQMGNGATSMTPVRRSVPVSGITDAIDIDAGDQFTCAVRGTGAVWCWGAGTYGQLGNRLGTDSDDPVAVIGVSGAIQVTAGSLHACALLRGGTVKCWGYGGYGQLGDGIADFTHEAHQAGDVMNLIRVEAIAAENMHTCALHIDGSIDCWGQNNQGQLGDGVGSGNSGLPVGVLDINDAEQIAGHCARLAGNTIACWGENGTGQVGDDSVVRAIRPARIDLDGVVDIDTSQDTACARVAAGDTFCWGRNDFGQLGIGASGDRHVPTLVMDMGDARSLGVGPNHACEIRVPGEVLCWGGNATGAVSDTGMPNHDTPVHVEGL